MIETVESEKGEKKHIIDKPDGVLHAHWKVQCGHIYAGQNELHHTNNPRDIENICQLCINAYFAKMQGIEYKSTGTIHGVDTYGENFQGDIVTFCGVHVIVGDDMFSDADAIISIRPKEVDCSRCQRSNRFQRIMPTEAQSV